MAVLPLTGEKSNFLVQTAWIVFFTALTAVGAQVEIPHQPVPYTLQTFFVLLGAAFLGSRNGSLSQLLYLGIGLAGGPVFSGGSFGLARLIGPSGGYLLSFPLASILVGYIVQLRTGYFWTLVGMFLGLVVVFTCGATFLNFFYLHNFKDVVHQRIFDLFVVGFVETFSGGRDLQRVCKAVQKGSSVEKCVTKFKASQIMRGFFV